MGSINNCFEADDRIGDNDIVTRSPQNYNSLAYPGKLKKIDISRLKNRSNSEKRLRNSNRPKNVDILTPFELCDEITDILRIRIPFFNCPTLQSLSNISFLTGNGPYHEGLLIITLFKNLYITQIYPITFVKVHSLYEALSGITSFNAFNVKSKKFQISDIYIPTQPITVMDIYSLVNEYPNKYNIFTQNCQKYCDAIIEKLNKKFKIKRENNPELTKFHYIKIKDSLKKKKKEGKNNITIDLSSRCTSYKDPKELDEYHYKYSKSLLFRRAYSYDNKENMENTIY